MPAHHPGPYNTIKKYCIVDDRQDVRLVRALVVQESLALHLRAGGEQDRELQNVGAHVDAVGKPGVFSGTDDAIDRELLGLRQHCPPRRFQLALQAVLVHKPG